jgi:regulator of sigma E protease
MDVQRYTALSRSSSAAVGIERNGATTVYTLPLTNNTQFGLKLLNLEPRDHPSVEKVIPGNPAEKAGLRVDDVFISFAGVPVVSQVQLVELIEKRSDKPSDVEVLRQGAHIHLTVTPKLDPQTQAGRIGVLLSPGKVAEYVVQYPGPTPWENVSQVLSLLADTAGALIHHQQTGVGAKDMTGPLGIMGKLASDAKADIRLALNFMVMVNLNLAILNLLPIPVLDGGHIMLACYELITRRRISARLQETVTMTFAVALISFMLYVTFFDVTRRGPLIKALLKQETVIENSGSAK